MRYYRRNSMSGIKPVLCTSRVARAIGRGKMPSFGVAPVTLFSKLCFGVFIMMWRCCISVWNGLFRRSWSGWF